MDVGDFSVDADLTGDEVNIDKERGQEEADVEQHLLHEYSHSRLPPVVDDELDRSIFEQRGVLRRQKSVHEYLVAVTLEFFEVKGLHSFLITSILEQMGLSCGHLSEHVQKLDPFHVYDTVLDFTQLNTITDISALVTPFLDFKSRSKVSL